MVFIAPFAMLIIPIIKIIHDREKIPIIFIDIKIDLKSKFLDIKPIKVRIPAS